jgi:acetolactate synthase-1/3 small subunit
MALIKVAKTAQNQKQLQKIAEEHGAQEVDSGPDAVILEFAGTKEKIDSFVEILRPYRILEMVCTGHIAMAGCSQPTSQSTLPDFEEQGTSGAQSISRSI